MFEFNYSLIYIMRGNMKQMVKKLTRLQKETKIFDNNV